MSRFRRVRTLALLFALIAGPLGCAKSGPEKYVIGFANPLTAGSADLGRLAQLGVMLRVKEINEAGGINGKQIEVLYNDDKSDPKEAANIAQLLASTPEVLAVIGHFNSSCTIAGKAVYAQAHLVEFSCA